MEQNKNPKPITLLGTIHKKLSRRAPYALVLLCVTLLVSACSNSDLDDLHDFIAKTKSKKAPPPEPIPEVKTYATYAYNETRLRDPFKRNITKAAVGKVGGPRPNPDRIREVLEQFPLDTLTLVGTLEKDSVRWALVKAQDGTLYRAKAGQHMGQDEGKIIKITETEVVLKELVADGLGGYIHRNATLSVAEP